MSTSSVIRSIVAEYGRLAVDIGQLDDDADLYRAGLASHACINLMLGLEASFDVEFPQRMLMKKTFSSVNAIRAALSELTDDASSAADDDGANVEASSGIPKLVVVPSGA